MENTAEELEERFEASRRTIEAGIRKNRKNLDTGKTGEWTEEGIPPYCV